MNKDLTIVVITGIVTVLNLIFLIKACVNRKIGQFFLFAIPLVPVMFLHLCFALTYANP